MNRVLFILILFLSIFAVSKSQDYWTLIPTPDTTSIISLAISDDDKYFIGTGTDDGIGGIYQSNDFGQNWEFNNLQNQNIFSISISPDNSLFSGTGHFIAKFSIDEEIWDTILTTYNNTISLNVEKNDTIYAGNWGNVLRSLDGGINWDTVLSFSNSTAVRSIQFSSDNILFVATTYFLGVGGIYRSYDFGETWDTILNANITDLELNSLDYLHATNQIDGLYRSSDDGETWDLYSNMPSDLMRIVINSYDYIFVLSGQHAGSESGIYVSYNNANTWDKLDSGLPSIIFYDLYLDPNEYLFVFNASNNPNGSLFRSVNTTVDLIEHNDISCKGYTLYPNPVKTRINLISDRCRNVEIENILIYNINGILLHSFGFIQNYLVGNSICLPVEFLSPGVYFLNIVTEKGVFFYKFIKY